MAGITVADNLYRAIPFAWPWVTGRLYDSYPEAAGYGTGAITNTQVEPFIIPNAISLASVNIEVVTTAATAGTLARFAIYYSDNRGWPDQLLADWGTVAVDATGLRTISISNYISLPGLYWVGFAQQTAATNAVYRVNSTTLFNVFPRDSIFNFNFGGGNSIQIGSANPIATSGFPGQFWRMSDNSVGINWSNASSPRILLGV